MRINQFVARATGLSRRVADKVTEQKHIYINGTLATLGSQVTENDTVKFDGKTLELPRQTTTIMFNKPFDYVCSRDGQGSRTIYELLPEEYKNLKPVGRLDKDSSGLLLLTNNGQLANELTHPKFEKTKIYEICLNKPLSQGDWLKITRGGVKLKDGLSKLRLDWIEKDDGLKWSVTMHEGRNRQIRRTFVSLGYQVNSLHRIKFGNYSLGKLKSGACAPTKSL